MNHTVLDLEMCKVPKSLRTKKFRWSQETIQIGAVLLDENYDVMKKFCSFVRPEYGRMDSFIEHLTGITKANVYTAKSFGEAIDAFLSWLPDSEVRCVSWSEADQKQIMHEMEAKNIEDVRLTGLLKTWIDCQRMFGEKMDSSRQYKLEEALMLGLKDLKDRILDNTVLIKI